MRARFLKLTGLVCLGLALALLSGCGPAIPNADQGVETGYLLWGNGAEPRSLDPHIATGVTENHIISALLEGLITYHPTDDNLPYPGVAERWESNADASVWTFYLNPEARWSNGDPVTAHDFVYSYRRILQPALAAEYSQMLYILQNAQPYFERLQDDDPSNDLDFSTVGVKALDDRTLQFTLEGPTSFFINMLKHYSWFPVHPPTIEAHGGMTDLSGNWTRQRNYVGNGPFVLRKWKPDSYILVEKSPTYWTEVKLNGIYYFPVNKDTTEKLMFDNGQLHITETVPTNEVPKLKSDPSVPLHIDPYLGTYYYRFNTTVEPLDDPRVRRALALAINRQLIVDRVTLAGQQPATAYVPPGFSGYTSPVTLTHDPEEARRLLAEAGFPNGEGFPALTLLFNTSEGHRKIAEAIVEQWNQTLNISMQLENAEWKVYLDRTGGDVASLDYDISRAAWIGDYMDPITFLEMFRTGNGNNGTGWSNAAYDALIASAFRSANQAEHIATLQQAEAILMDELPICPIYWYVRVSLRDPRVQNWHPKLLDNRPLREVYLAEE